ncbi:hypothetical protein O1611_g3799 [Lasiodiplodia mahajangana]|uniref:Uncharacterized protein n=1 Tax=Lasiodiplodia mahajangana TaxID=1108764 RepID=A0ACC2JQQ4_9PEZI|nr:hypothetical protein O1611_g3799 [Lasiodiplodia mahajangana]
MAEEDAKPTVSFNRDGSQWPMTFALQPPPTDTAPPRRWWDHKYYRGPGGEPVKVLYSKTKWQSESIARQFVNEPILGFDMEWPWDADKRPKLKDKVALIQLASETKVGLFHISLHEGDTVDDLIAPSLKEIIESSKIIKAGVNILRADFYRLKTHFNLEPKGAFELSHLYNLVAYGSTEPRRVTTRLRNLSMQVEHHLGLPLMKGSVRTSDWSRPLNFYQTQYAATDAYAGFMLFHCMNAKRLAMDPVPPFPTLCETYLASPAPKSTLVRLESVSEDGEMRTVTAVEFFAVDQNTEGEGGTEVAGGAEGANASGNNQRAAQKKERKPKETKLAAIGVETPMDSSCWTLYHLLASHRMQLARSKGTAPFIIAHNTTLKALAIYRPLSEKELLRVPGIGKGKADEYGAAWLEIITPFVAEHGRSEDQATEQGTNDQGGQKDPGMESDDRDPKRRKIDSEARQPEEIPIASDEPAAVAAPSTNLLPQLGGTNPATEPLAPPQLEMQDDSDDYEGDSVFESPIDLPPPSVLKRKRDAVAPSGPQVQQNRSQPVIQAPVLIPDSPPPVKAEPVREPPSITNSEPKPPRTPTSRPVPMSTLTRSRALTASRLRPQLPPERLALERALLKRKLEAYIKSVVRALRPSPTEPLASESMLQYLVTTVPRTIEEFRRAPGMQRLMQACETVKMDVWRAFEKWTQNPRAAPGTVSTAAPRAFPRIIPGTVPGVFPSTGSLR